MTERASPKRGGLTSLLRTASAALLKDRKTRHREAKSRELPAASTASVILEEVQRDQQEMKVCFAEGLGQENFALGGGGFCVCGDKSLSVSFSQF